MPYSRFVDSVQVVVFHLVMFRASVPSLDHFRILPQIGLDNCIALQLERGYVMNIQRTSILKHFRPLIFSHDGFVCQHVFQFFQFLHMRSLTFVIGFFDF